MRSTALSVGVAVLLASAAWTVGRSSPATERRIMPVAGADYVISLAVFHQVQAPTAPKIVSVTYSLAKGDGAVAHEGRVQAEATGNVQDVVARLIGRATDEISDVVIAGSAPRRPSSMHPIR